MLISRSRIFGWIIVCSCFLSSPTLGQDVARETVQDVADVAPNADQAKLFEDFRSLFEKSVMIGTFMVDGDNSQKRSDERYEISKIAKQEKGDYWVFFARIKYGDHDVTVPVPVEVKWAGDTPVITVDNVLIPGMGTFDSRVVISDGKYAGTWRHGKVGGLMFGRLEKQSDVAKSVEK